MFDFSNKEIKLRVHLKGGKIFDFTPLLKSVKWSGDYRTPFRTLDVSYIRTNLDDDIVKKDITIGSTACFYVDNKEIFRGNCVDVDKSSNENYINVLFKDLGMFLMDSKSYNFSNTSVIDIARKVINDGKPKLRKGYFAPADTKITKMFLNQTGYDIIMSAYTEHSKATKGKWKYMVKAGLDNINIIEKGVHFIKIQFSEAYNLESTTYKQSLEGFCNRVLITDDKGNKVSEKVDSELMKVFNGYMTTILTKDEKKDVTAEQIKNSFKGTHKTISLKGFGDVSCTTGLKVRVSDTYTHLTGIFYVDKDTHIWEEGKYSIELDLNFDNLMDEKTSGQDESKEGSSLADGSTDWGHGVTVEQLNKILKGRLANKGALFWKLGNMYKVNPMVIALIMRQECGPNFDSYNARVRNNFGGITKDPKYPNEGRFAKFPSVDIGIERNFRLLSVKYLNKDKIRDVGQIINIYAPPSENNTAKYISDLKSNYKKYTGKDWSNSLLGTGVASEQEAHRRVIAKGSSTVEKAVAYAESKVGYKYDQSKRMSEGYFDCSSLCYRAYASAGVYDPKKWAFTSSTVSKNPSQYGLKKVPLADIQRGDILWKSGHLGLYIGDGKTVEAKSKKLGVRYGRSSNFSCGYRLMK